MALSGCSIVRVVQPPVALTPPVCTASRPDPPVDSLIADATSPIVSSTATIDVARNVSIARDDMPITHEQPRAPLTQLPPAVDASQPKREVEVPDRVPPPAPPKPDHTVRLPDEVVVRAFDTGRAAFLRCFARAQDEDPTLTSIKVRLHLVIDRDGAVTAVTTDAPLPRFDRCLSAVSRALRFSPPGADAMVDAPLFF